MADRGARRLRRVRSGLYEHGPSADSTLVMLARRRRHRRPLPRASTTPWAQRRGGATGRSARRRRSAGASTRRTPARASRPKAPPSCCGSASTDLGLRRVAAGAFADNAASIRVMEKIGMRHRGPRRARLAAPRPGLGRRGRRRVLADEWRTGERGTAVTFDRVTSWPRRTERLSIRPLRDRRPADGLRLPLQTPTWRAGCRDSPRRTTTSCCSWSRPRHARPHPGRGARRGDHRRPVPARGGRLGPGRGRGGRPRTARPRSAGPLPRPPGPRRTRPRRSRSWCGSASRTSACAGSRPSRSPTTPPSLRIMERLGMRQEAVYRQDSLPPRPRLGRQRRSTPCSADEWRARRPR